MPRRTRVVAAAVSVACVLATSITGAAQAPAGPITTVAQAADVGAAAVPLAPQVDLVSITQRNGLTATTRQEAIVAASQLGVPVIEASGFSLGMRSLRRGSTIVRQSTAAGWGFPMAITALTPATIGGIMGRDIAAPISLGQVVMGQTSATFHGAQAGDRIELIAVGGSTAFLTIGMIAPDDVVGGTELLMSTATAGSLGMNVTTRLLLYGHLDHAAVATALAASGVAGTSTVRVSRSWDPAGPDDTIGLAAAKVLLGEFDMDYVNLSPTGWTAIGTTWRNAYLPPTRELYSTGILAMCNVKVKADLEAALAEVLATNPGLVNSSPDSASQSSGLDIANANQYGGCTIAQARLSRVGVSTGTVSRHAWGEAFDVSTVANCQGCVPAMDCRIVRIFREHGFAWGGNFLKPDGMHFEWVGEARNLVQTPVQYCPNVALPPTQSTTRSVPLHRATLFADDGLAGE